MKILISPGYGAGWSTWNERDMAIDGRLIHAFENGMTEEGMKELCKDLGYSQTYMGGFDELKVVEVPEGTVFRVHEYDGYESIEVLDMDDWFVAK